MKQTLFADQINSFEFNCVEALIWFLLHNIGERNCEEFFFRGDLDSFTGVLGLDKRLLALLQLEHLLGHRAAK